MELAAEFPPTSREEWRALVGVPEADLSRTTYDDLVVAPLYDRSDLPSAPRVVRAGTGWDVRQRHTVADTEAVLADLENGVTSLWLVVGPDAIPVSALRQVLKDVYLDLAPVVLDAGPLTGQAANALFGLAASRDLSLRGNLGAVVSGDPAADEVAIELALICAAEHPGLRAITVDALPHHDAGAGDAQELGCSMAAGVAQLRALTAAGLSIEQALGQLEFRYAATDDQFATIAKLRAARRMWARIAAACGAPGAAAQAQHAVTSSAMMTARDPWVNMLRTTVAAFAAGVGGADTVTTQPFDACLRRPEAFSRRIARNAQLLLLEEAGVGRVADPAGGSWYVERRTADLAERAWAWFQELEAAADPAALAAERIAATRARRDDDIAHRRFPITGVSEFPDAAEEPVPSLPGGYRYAEPYERLRDLADARPERPKVFLATIGPLAEHTARASFAANLFAAGGLATETAGVSTDPEQIATAFAVSGSTVACLCSSDRLYGEHAEAVAAALRRAGARRVWLAGKGDYRGVDGHLFTGCDALGVLRTTLDDLEVAR
ncbi:methylmalonyl-CoA mutase family protein [Nonomuraea sp. NPDC050536]|uniref:methylmalonyl-CoA mutase family protein n=1 Tax=Nonomuraea sp. NPDC050536 TaxID=3364366 RepID=UPI0037CA27B6